jgi:RNA polymerase sigma factor (sigma-70 family)
LLFARIIIGRSLYQKGGFEKVPDELGQLSWAGFAQGDADVWRDVIGQQIPRLYSIFMRRWPNPSLAEELVQKTVFDAVRGRSTYDPSKGSPEEWILGIARNNISLEFRRRTSRPSPNGDVSKYLEAIDTEPLPDEVLERKETAGIVRSALSRLEAKEQNVLNAKYIEGLPARDIAQQMDVTEKAIHSLLHRARISLREELRRLALQDIEGQKP